MNRHDRQKRPTGRYLLAKCGQNLYQVANGLIVWNHPRISGDRMEYHHYARLTISSRDQLAKSVVEGRVSLREAAAARRLSRQSASKWVRSYRQLGVAGLAHRSSRPRSCPRSAPVFLIQRVAELRRERKTGVEIALTTGLSRASVSRILTRLKLNRIHMLEPKLPPNR
jgi:transposase